VQGIFLHKRVNEEARKGLDEWSSGGKLSVNAEEAKSLTGLGRKVKTGEAAGRLGSSGKKLRGKKGGFITRGANKSYQGTARCYVRLERGKESKAKSGGE